VDQCPVRLNEQTEAPTRARYRRARRHGGKARAQRVVLLDRIAHVSAHQFFFFSIGTQGELLYALLRKTSHSNRNHKPAPVFFSSGKCQSSQAISDRPRSAKTPKDGEETGIEVQSGYSPSVTSVFGVSVTRGRTCRAFLPSPFMGSRVAGGKRTFAEPGASG
jgi:hypothetical protein